MFQRCFLLSLLLLSLLMVEPLPGLTSVRHSFKRDLTNRYARNGHQSTGAETIAASPAQSLPLVGQILDKYVQALGGKAAIQAVTSRAMKGTITAPAYKISGTIEVYAKAPNKQLTEIQAPILGLQRTGFDGTVAWEQEDGEVKDASGFSKRDADFYFPINMLDLYPKLELKGQEKVGNTVVFRLEAPRGGNPKRWYFAADTGLLIRTEVRDGAGKLVSSEDYEDYRAVDGIKIPFTVRQLEDGLETVTKLTEVKHNVPIDDAKFAKPVPKKTSALSPDEQKAESLLKAETIREITTTLTSREMEGRGIGQPGGERAAKYIAGKFAAFGLKPGGDASTFFQTIKFRSETELPGTSLKVGENIFKFNTDFAVASPHSPSAKKDVSGEVVFVGYGVVSKELNRDDLAGLNLSGKIVLLLGGKPDNLSDGAWDKEVRVRDIYERLIKKGAAGIIEVYRGNANFEGIAKLVSNRSITLAEPIEEKSPPAVRWSIELLADKFDVPPAVLISETTANKIFAALKSPLSQLKQKAQNGKFVSQNLEVQASIAPRFKPQEIVTSSNVIGLIEGSDAKLKTEAVVFTAHYDAFSISSDGTIYPGAADNALGVGKLLAMAEVFAQMNPKPRRTLIFIATTGEEYGDLGAEYWLAHPTWSLEKTAADINYDGSITEVWGKFGFVLDLGFDNSDLNETVKSAAAASDIEVIPDPLPEEQFFTRSDHYAFVKSGIPSLFLSGGPANDDPSLLERAQKWMAENYHMPTDEIQSDWNWEGARGAAIFGLLVGMRVANQEAMPKWKADSPFNRPRGTYTSLPPGLSQ